ncbi:MAG: transcriptional regulator [Actinomycetes bacterium]|nr:transcriptional regulator [Actinomycetes bacterium]MDX5380275.1 transcriptional regulator [Actinomycetes bacterium]MDX5398993.1 transcriptional regulator [Actinomycetes bacterium]MDX5450002.1 transcriptional regulator [Actinomycetes bacterium]
MHPPETRRRALRMVEAGDSLRSISLALGVSRAAIREWVARGPSSLEAGCPLPLEPARYDAYSALLGYYLGDGCLGRNRRTWSLRVSCDETYPGIVEDVASCMRGVRQGCCVGFVPAPGVTVVQAYWQHWPCLFPQHGPGRKHERTMPMEAWQWEIVEAHPGDFLRGLFHSDGARVRNWATRRVAGEVKRYEYPRWQFVNRSEQILGWCEQALDLAGVPWRRSNRWTVSVSRREAVARLDGLIGLKQ